MKLICLGSSSKGNSYILQDSNGYSIILECGVPIKELKKSLNFDLSKVLGAFITHIHKDHSGRINEYCKAGIDVWIEAKTKKLIDIENHRLKTYREMEIIILGEFRIKSFPVIHDVPTVGFLLDHTEMGRVVFITDTKYLNFNFPELDHILIEANYSLDIMNERLISGSLQGYLKNRIQESHLSLETCKEFLKANDLSMVQNIILLHLSDSNSDEPRFIKEVQELTGKAVYVADTGRTFELNANPF